MGKFDNGSLWRIAEQSQTYANHSPSLSLSLSPHHALPISISHACREGVEEVKGKLFLMVSCIILPHSAKHCDEISQEVFSFLFVCFLLCVLRPRGAVMTR